MKSATVIDFTAYVNRQDDSPSSDELQEHVQLSCSDELGMAIQTLIEQMRKSFSLKQTG